MMPLLDARSIRGRGAADESPLVSSVVAARHRQLGMMAAALGLLAVIGMVSQQRAAKLGQANLLSLPVRGAHIDPNLETARHSEQRAVAQLTVALDRAERGFAHKKVATLSNAAALAAGQRLFAEDLAPSAPSPMAAVSQSRGRTAEEKIAQLQRKKEQAKREVAKQRKLENKLLAQLATTATPSTPASAILETAADKTVAGGISSGIANLAGEIRQLTAAASADAAQQQQQQQQKKDAMQSAIDAAARGTPISASLATQQPSLTPLVGLNTNSLLPPPTTPAAASSAATAPTAIAQAMTALAEGEEALSKSILTVEGMSGQESAPTAANAAAGTAAEAAGCKAISISISISIYSYVHVYIDIL